MSTFRVGVGRDFLDKDGKVSFGDIGLDRLDAAGVEWSFLDTEERILTPGDIAEFDALFLLLNEVTAETLVGNTRLALIARFGVGTDSIDLAACTEAGVAVSVTPDGVRRGVATALLTAVLALAHRLRERDLLVRESRWSEKMNYIGTGLTGRTLGIAGVGNIGADFSRLAQPLEMRHLAYDPYASEDMARKAGVTLVDFDTLLAESDFLCLSLPLTDETHHLVNARAFAAMKPTSYLINAARGPIVNEVELIEALRSGQIAGAALDVFDPEPPAADNPLFTMDNVLLTPHAIAHTDETFTRTGHSAVDSILAVMNGQAPSFVANRQVVDSPAFAARIAARHTTKGEKR
ncbi:MAG: NAD(P)-dependent oxidoreductase [Microcella sp.]|uniref:NAD(P)-dependent oxidoreductase n=1 Tax=Microcella sp. TaxID=1913979 RepID=UPI0033158968